MSLCIHYKKAAIGLFLVLTSCGGLVLHASAQEGLDNLLGTAGTTVQDTSGRTWAYLLWDATTPRMLLGQTFAVYVKPGDPTNTAPYVRMAVLSQQADPRVIEPLLLRGVNLGDDLSNLSAQLDGLFARLLPVSTLPTADKLSAVIRGSIADDESFRNLLLLTRLHPGVALACGVGYAQVVTNLPVTFELRSFDSARNRDLGVFGRITLSGGDDRLPAPGCPIEVVDATPKGDLNVKLRWATPDTLRRAGLRQHGFNVWRVSKAYAESNGWHTTPPVQLHETPYLVLRLNRHPILTSRDFTTNDVVDFTPPTGDSNTVFFADDDGRFETGYNPVLTGFTNGAQFYYFATARDMLGRDGAVSPGRLVTVCDRMPPLPPNGLRVGNEYAYTNADPQHLRVVWNQVTNAADAITHYWVYRWRTVEDISSAARDPSSNRIAVVAHTNGLAKASYLDDGPGSPTVPADLGKTFWYTVRAQDSGACGPNLSANSGPAFGVLRDREGPGAAVGCVRISSITPYVVFMTTNWSSAGVFGQFALTLNCTRESPEIAYAAFTVVVQDSSARIVETINSGRLYFARGSSLVSFPVLCSKTNQFNTALVQAVVVTADNRSSVVAQRSLLLDTKLPPRITYNFEAWVAETSQCGDGGKHHPRDVGSISREPVKVVFTAPSDSTEYRVYRRVDGGVPTLLCQGATLTVTNTCTDDSLPPNAAEICYYVQVLDKHGNTSPMADLGCITIQPPRDTLPIPKLSPITPTNVSGSDGMVLCWFCPSAGVERFHVGIAGPLGSPIATDLTAATNFDGIAPPSGAVSNLFLQAYATPRLGTAFTNGPLFTAIVTNIRNGEYTVFVRAVAKDGTCGDWSEPGPFERTSAASTSPEVPWPWRKPPEIKSRDSQPFASVVATNLSKPGADFYGGAVLIGSQIFPTNYVFNTFKPQFITRLSEDPTHFVFKSGEESLFPLTLYRCQVTNVAFPRVSGDILQVSPLMETIAYLVSTNAGVIENTLADPFILYEKVPMGQYWNLNVYLLDTQPVIRGARYRYFLAHFADNREIEYILPTNEMEVP